MRSPLFSKRRNSLLVRDNIGVVFTEAQLIDSQSFPEQRLCFVEAVPAQGLEHLCELLAIADDDRMVEIVRLLVYLECSTHQRYRVGRLTNAVEDDGEGGEVG